MTRVRALDGTHDWLFGKGQNDYLTRNAAVIQDINTRLNCFLGDCFFDTGAGLNWWVFLGGSKDQSALSLAISAVILKTKDVTGLRQLSIALPATRGITVSYQVQTSFSAPSGQFSLDGNTIGGTT